MAASGIFFLGLVASVVFSGSWCQGINLDDTSTMRKHLRLVGALTRVEALKKPLPSLLDDLGLHITSDSFDGGGFPKLANVVGNFTLDEEDQWESQVTPDEVSINTDGAQKGVVPCTAEKEIQDVVPPSKLRGGSEDITEEMIASHLPFVVNHHAKPFEADERMRREAMKWCKMQSAGRCDLMYPHNLSFSAAVVPGYTTANEVVQFWYNQGENYDYEKTLIGNLLGVMRGEKGEVLNFAHIVAGYPGRGIGCCRAPCADNKGCEVYGCAYAEGAGSWRHAPSKHPEEDTKNALREATEDDVPINNTFGSRGSFEFHAPGDIGAQRIRPPAINIVRSVPLSTMFSAGCPANIAGNGANVTVEPYRYYCEESGPLTPKEIEAVTAPLNKTDFPEFLIPKPLVEVTCDDTELPPLAPKSAVIICPSSCTTRTHYFLPLNDTEHLLPSNPKPPFDAGRSVCGQAAVQGQIGGSGGLVAVKTTPDGKLEFRNTGYNNKKCSAVRANLEACAQSKGRHCSLHVKLNNGIWFNYIAKEDFAALENGPSELKQIYLSQNSLCQDVLIKSSANGLKTVTGSYGLIVRWINPQNFIILEVAIHEGSARFIGCHNGKCVNTSRYLVGGLTYRPLNIEVKAESTSVTAVINGEKCGSITEARLLTGYVGMVVSDDDILKHVTDFESKPINPRRTVLPDPFSSSLLKEVPLV